MTRTIVGAREVPLITGGEARYHDTDCGKHMQLDEVVTSGRVHIERMDTNEVLLIVDDGPREIRVGFYTDAPHRLRMFVVEGETS